MNKPIYRIVLLGTTGVGKSQLCNFIIKDNLNRTFEVSDSFDSHTQVPQSIKFNRNKMNIDIIDTAGCCDSGGNDDKNFKILIEFLREKESITLFMIVINFADDRLNEKTRDYIRFISETFTPTEFYNHLVIVFTHYTEKPNKKKIEK
jgi:predicted GTPase